MRKILGLTLIIILLAALGSSAYARRRHHGRRVEVVEASSSRNFGLGLILGGPTGLSGKLFMGDAFALDFAVGWYTGWNNEGVGAHVDLLWHPVLLAATDAFMLPLYFGVGARIVDDRDCGGRFCSDNGVDVGVRVPLGISFELNAVPLDIFLEIALTIDFIDPSGGDHVGLDGALGIRYWF